MAQLINDANLTADISGVPQTAHSSVTVELTDIWFNKKADKTTWTNGSLTYTIEMKNNGDPTAVPPGAPLTDVAFTDTIDVKIAKVIESTIATVPASAYVAHTYNATTGELEIELTDIPAGATVAITFQVERAL